MNVSCRLRSVSNAIKDVAAMSVLRYYLSTKFANTVYPKKYAHGFVAFCFVVVMQSFIMNSHEVFIHIHQGCFAGTGAIVRLPQCQWSKPDGYGKISQCITTTKHSKAKTVCIFLGKKCTWTQCCRFSLSTYTEPMVGIDSIYAGCKSCEISCQTIYKSDNNSESLRSRYLYQKNKHRHKIIQLHIRKITCYYAFTTH